MIRSCREVESIQPVSSRVSIDRFMWRIDMRAPNRLRSWLDSRQHPAHVVEITTVVVHGSRNGDDWMCWPYSIVAMVDAFRRKHASITDPVHEHSTWASGSQNSNG